VLNSSPNLSLCEVFQQTIYLFVVVVSFLLFSFEPRPTARVAAEELGRVLLGTQNFLAAIC
jgi:hypothetical protein